MSHYPVEHHPIRTPRAIGRWGVVLVLVGTLLAAGGLRIAASRVRASIEPEINREVTGNSDDVTLGQLNSFTFALLLGGLRGPLVMALWSSSEQQKVDRDFQDFETKIELIRLLQPQFNSVHLYQIWNKAYNLSVEMANVSSRYAVVLDAIDYAKKVLDERPNNIDLETQLGEVYANKLGGAQEKDYFIRRVLDETKADEGAVRIEFPVQLEGEVRRAALIAGVSPRSMIMRRSDEPGRMVTAFLETEAERIRNEISGDDVEYEHLAAREVNARGIGGPLRLEPMVDADGNLLPSMSQPVRADVASDGTFLDGSELQFLRSFAPFPEGIAPHALGYNRYMKALVLQEFAGQRHVQRSEQFIEANPGRALRDWAITSFEHGRLLEAEAYGLNPMPPGNSGELQAQLERDSADFPPFAEPTSERLLSKAQQQYERSIQVGEAAVDYLNGHLRNYPEAAAIFGSTISRLQDLGVLLEADGIYIDLVLNQADDRETARRQAVSLYREASSRMLSYVLQYHTPQELLPEGMWPEQLVSQPIEFRLEMLEMLRSARDANPVGFEHTRVLDEFDGYFERINIRLRHLREAAPPA